MDTRPTIEFLSPRNRRGLPVTLIGYGEVRPLEQTQLASQWPGSTLGIRISFPRPGKAR